MTSWHSPESDEAEAQKTIVNLDQLVKEAVSEVRQETSGRSIEWKIENLPQCYGDRSMLRLVLVKPCLERGKVHARANPRRNRNRMRCWQQA